LIILTQFNVGREPNYAIIKLEEVIKMLDNDIKIGKAIRHFRKQANLTQAQVNHRLEKGRTWCSDIERGKQTISYPDVITLCEMFNISVETLTNKVLSK
jgi:DNA-binding XRE family transcriptional regulator